MMSRGIVASSGSGTSTVYVLLDVTATLAAYLRPPRWRTDVTSVRVSDGSGPQGTRRRSFIGKGPSGGCGNGFHLKPRHGPRPANSPREVT